VPNVYADLRIAFKATTVKSNLLAAINLSFSAKYEQSLKITAIANLKISVDTAQLALNDELAKLVPIAQINILALAYKNCVKPSTAPAEIVGLEKKLNALIKEQLDYGLHASYWDDKLGSQVYLSQSLFPIIDTFSMNESVVPGRRLASSYSGDDLILISENRGTRLSPWDGPSRITTCEKNGILTGFQVFYGTTQMYKAGSAHGSLDSVCKNTPLDKEVSEVSFYGSETNGKRQLEGMTMTL